MGTMTAKDYLRQVKKARSAQRRLVNEALTLREQAERITTSMSASGGRGGDGRKIENAAIRLADLSEEFEQKAKEYARIEADVLKTVNTLEEPYADLLYLRYFEGIIWEDIAHELHYSLQHVHKLHRTALAMIHAIVCDYTQEVLLSCENTQGSDADAGAGTG